MNPTDRKRLVDRYTERFAIRGYGPDALGWGKGGRQKLRFAALLSCATERRGSVLDVGCGFGDLRDYLEAVGWRGEYHGVDLVPVLIDEARARHPGDSFEVLDLLENQAFTERYDFVVGCGVFNLCLIEEPHEEYVREMMQRMFELARVAVAVDFMTDMVDFRHAGAYHPTPLAMLGRALSISRRVAMRHDYLPFEFCIHMFKQTEITESSTYGSGYSENGVAHARARGEEGS